MSQMTSERDMALEAVLTPGGSDGEGSGRGMGAQPICYQAWLIPELGPVTHEQCTGHNEIHQKKNLE